MKTAGLFFALLSAFSFGLGNVYWKITMKDDHFPRVVFFRGLMAILFMALIALCIRWYQPNNDLIRPIAASGAELVSYVALFFCCSLGIIVYLKSLEFEPVIVSIPLSTINVFSILTSVWVIGEEFKSTYYLLFFLSATGVYLLLYGSKVATKLWNKGAGYALLASIVWGITYPLFKYPASKMGALTMALLVESCVCLSAFCWYCFSFNWKKMFNGIKGPQLKHYTVLALVLIFGTLGYNLAIQRIDVIVLNITGKLTFLTSIALGILLLKEKLDLKKAIGMLFILASLILANN